MRFSAHGRVLCVCALNARVPACVHMTRMRLCVSVRVYQCTPIMHMRACVSPGGRCRRRLRFQRGRNLRTDWADSKGRARPARLCAGEIQTTDLRFGHITPPLVSPLVSPLRRFHQTVATPRACGALSSALVRNKLPSTLTKRSAVPLCLCVSGPPKSSLLSASPLLGLLQHS